MLRLFAHLKDNALKLREASAHESFTPSFTWEKELEVECTQDPKYMMSWTSLLPDLQPQKARALVELIGARYPVSPRYWELHGLCPEFVFQAQTDEWTFYGGTFNPWHQGHQACLDLIPQDKICLVLPDLNPHKNIPSFELVSSIIGLSSKIQFSSHQFLVPSFLINKTQNPTVQWMERLKKDFPEKKLSLLMGFDSLANMARWTRSKDLLPLLHCLYVVSRLETPPMREEAIKPIKLFSPLTEIQFLGGHKHERVSSSAIRKHHS